MWMSRILAGARSLMIVKRQGGCHFQKWLCLSYTSDLVTRSSESNLLVSIPLPRPSISSSLGLSLCPSNTSAPTPAYSGELSRHPSCYEARRIDQLKAESYVVF